MKQIIKRLIIRLNWWSWKETRWIEIIRWRWNNQIIKRKRWFIKTIRRSLIKNWWSEKIKIRSWRRTKSKPSCNWWIKIKRWGRERRWEKIRGRRKDERWISKLNLLIISQSWCIKWFNWCWRRKIKRIWR
jgi:hypothetical protein